MHRNLHIRDNRGLDCRQDIYPHLSGFHKVDADAWGLEEAWQWHRRDHLSWEKSADATPVFTAHVHPGEWW